jgi:hypothetical protein
LQGVVEFKDAVHEPEIEQNVESWLSEVVFFASV